MAKNAQRFAELEYALQKYFDGKVATVMTAVKDDLGNKRADELKAYQRSTAGILSLGNYDKAGDTSMAVLKYTGQWNSKTVEDYVSMCQKKLQNDKAFQKDLITLATEWRNAVVKEIGRTRYDELSKQLGTDLAYAYVGTRMDDLMMNKLVKDKMPKSTADYIIRKTAQGSIWGLEQELTKSPLAREIEAKGEAAFKPGKVAKVAGKLGGAVVDAATLSAGSWKSFAYYIGGDVLINTIATRSKGKEQKEVTMEAAISKGVFGSDANVLTTYRQRASKLQGKDNAYLTSLNSKLYNKIPTPSKPLMNFIILDTTKTAWQPVSIPGLQKPADRTSGKYKDVPLIVAPGQEDAYLEVKAKAEAQKKQETGKKPESKPAKQDPEQPQNEPQSVSTPSVDNNPPTGTEENVAPSTTASNGWDQLMQTTGFDGITDVGKNLGYVVSMLPDVLVGMFTGKTQSLNMKNSLMPVASILLGLFVRNPLLKMALIGIGGTNLVTRAGKESLNWQHEKNEGSQQQRFKQYADEPLNPRITNPVLQGMTLIANIDHVPCNIQLTQNVVAAYQSGALPLNTLANAVLNRYDATRMSVQQQYGQVEQQTIQQSESIHRTR